MSSSATATSAGVNMSVARMSPARPAYRAPTSGVSWDAFLFMALSSMIFQNAS